MFLAPANLLQIAIAAIALVGVFLTIGRPRLRAATAMMSMATLWMLFNLAEESLGTRDIWLVTPAFRLAYPPLFYLLVRGLIFSGASLRPSDWPHVVPFVLGLALTPQVWLVEHAARFSLVAYLLASIWLLHRYHATNQNRRSDAETIQLRRIYVVIAVFVLDAIFDVVRMDARWLHQDWPWLASSSAYLVQLGISFLLTVVTILFAVRRAHVFDGLQPGQLAPLVDVPPTDGPADEEVFERIAAIVRAQHLQTEPRLTRAELAEAAELPERQVSQAIRAATGRNFNDFINSLRIEDVQAMMREDAASGERRKILDLAYTAGFSSKSVFNAVFKRETGMTPSAFSDSLSNRV